MPTRQELEQALINADAAGDTQAATALANALSQGKFDQPAQDDRGLDVAGAKKDGAQSGFGAASVPLEFMAAVNRGAAKLADFLTTDQINAVANIIGSEMRVPSIEGALSPATSGGFMGDGLGRDVTRAAGEVIPGAIAAGGVFRQAAQSLPALTARSEGVVPGVIRQMGQAAPASDVVYGAASGAGSEIGRQEGGAAGQIAGGILAPASIAAGQSSLKGLLQMGSRGIEGLSKTVGKMSDDGAATMIAEMMVRDGLSPDDVARELAKLGPEGRLADVGDNFSRLLRLAANRVPRISGRAARELSERHSGQGERILSAFDDSAGVPKLSMDDEIIRLNEVAGPQIRKLYEDAAGGAIEMTPRLSSIIEKSPTVSEAMARARKSLADVEAMGQSVSDVRVFDQAKKEIDDMIGVAIRQGEGAKVSRLTGIKNALVDEIDSAVPAYKQARDAFAGKAQLESAAEFGTQFFKLKPREITRLVEKMGESEKRFFRLGAKQAIVDKLEGSQLNRDVVKAMFGRGGDMTKLRAVFDSDESMKRFSEVIEREANFVMTRRSAQGNSTTAQQMFDKESMSANALADARRALTDPVEAAGVLGRITSGLGAKKGEEANIRALEKAGDILLEAGLDPRRVQALIKNGTRDQVRKILTDTMMKKGSGIGAPTAGAIAAGQKSELEGRPDA